LKLLNNIDFTIAIAPNATSIEQDLLYIKSALLYADSITLISPMASTFFQLTNEADRKNDRTLYSLIDKVLPFCISSDPIACANMQPVLEQLGQVLYSKQWKSIPTTLKMQTSKALKTFGCEISEALIKLLGETNCNELIDLVKKEKVRLYNFQNQFSNSPDDYVHEFFDILTRSVSNTQTFPLFDNQSNNLIKSAINENIITLNDSNVFNAQQAGLTNALLVALPSFEYATTSEILDIRKELDTALIRFRGKMLSYNSEIQSLPWDEEFEPECFRLYQKEIAPSVLEIDELTKDSGFLKNLGYSVLADDSALKSAGGLILSVAAAGAVSTFTEIMSSDAAMLTTGGVYAVGKLANAYKEYRDKQKGITRKDMYFYYRAGKILSKKHGKRS